LFATHEEDDVVRNADKSTNGRDRACRLGGQLQHWRRRAYLRTCSWVISHCHSHVKYFDYARIELGSLLFLRQHYDRIVRRTLLEL
jgi:hypothetical protein